MTASPLDDFTEHQLTYENKTKPVYRKGSGPAVIVIAEMPGITPEVAVFARRVADAGFTVVMPSLFGVDGAPVSVTGAAAQMAKACVSKEFVCFATAKTSPVTSWLRALANDVHQECGGPGVGAIGMCFTGGFALGMMIDPVLIAPILSQPSLPFAVSAKSRRDLGLSDEDLAIVKERAAGGCDVLGLRFTGDKFVPGDRFARLRDELGDAFIGVEIDSSEGNPHGISKSAHSVVTNDLVDEPGHPTHDALQQVLTFLADRLQVA